MPTYPYECPGCQHTWEVIKRVADIDQAEACPKCQAEGQRYISRTHFYGASDWDKAEWNPGLGCVTKGAKHRQEMARRRGVEEIGNDYRDPSDHYRDNERRREAELARAYDKI